MGNTTKQNILMVHNYYQIPGGEDTVVANEKKMLEKHGHKVILYTRNNSELKQMSKVRKLALPFTTVFNLRTYKEVNNLILKEDIDIVHVHNTLNLISPSVYYAARKQKIPVVQTIHNFRLLCPGATFYRNGHICEDCVEYGLRCAVKHKCYRGSKVQTIACVVNTILHRMTGIYGKINYICLTDFNKEKLLKLKQIKQEKVFVKPNFVENKNMKISDKKNQFVFAGRLDKLKGIDVLFDAWNTMGDDAPKLIVCGVGPLEQWCKEFAKKNTTNIELRGFLSNYEVRKLVACSKALILPTQCYEGFPMSIVEAFSVGTPVICSNIGNTGCIVENNVNGITFDPHNINELIKAVKEMNVYTGNVIKTYNEKYSEDANYEILRKIYMRIDI